MLWMLKFPLVGSWQYILAASTVPKVDPKTDDTCLLLAPSHMEESITYNNGALPKETGTHSPLILKKSHVSTTSENHVDHYLLFP